MLSEGLHGYDADGDAAAADAGNFQEEGPSEADPPLEADSDEDAPTLFRGLRIMFLISVFIDSVDEQAYHAADAFTRRIRMRHLSLISLRRTPMLTRSGSAFCHLPMSVRMG